MSATYPPPDQLERVVTLLTELLGEQLVGAYLYGSAVVGGLKPASDLDVLAVTAARTSPAQRRALIAGLRPLSSRAERRATWRPVELTVAALPDLAPPRYPPRVDFQSGEWLRQEFDAGEPRPWRSPNPDLLIVLSHVRRASTALIGPPARELLPEIPTTDLARAMTEEIGSLLDDLQTDTANVLLTLARIWHTLTTQDFAPKDAAADWALAQMGEPLAALETARNEYVGEASVGLRGGDTPSEGQAEAEAAARFLIGRIEGLAGRSYNRGR
jgi:streptomycin 3"-adenylyltransferase